MGPIADAVTRAIKADEIDGLYIFRIYPTDLHFAYLNRASSVVRDINCVFLREQIKKVRGGTIVSFVKYSINKELKQCRNSN